MIIAALILAATPPAETPRAFVERIYANYHKPNYSPLLHPERVFTPRLAAAIAEDSRLNRGDVGYLDGDPVCQCQDTSGMRATVSGVKQQGRDQATVGVLIRFTGYEPRPARLSLVRTKAGWRIADVSSADEPSFLHGIEASNRRLRARR